MLFCLLVLQVVTADVRKLLKDCLFFALSLDEVSSLLVSYMCVHVYVLDRHFKRHALYLMLAHIDSAPNADNLTKTLVDTLATAGGMEPAEVASKLGCIAADGASVLQGYRNGLLVQVCCHHAWRPV